MVPSLLFWKVLGDDFVMNTETPTPLGIHFIYLLY